ncbi:MAG: alpha-L-fucosidase [Pyrinomonadaceae bacterium]|nr:alpha-L-fucosidase [Phycisphaerales bacterium]
MNPSHKRFNVSCSVMLAITGLLGAMQPSPTLADDAVKTQRPVPALISPDDDHNTRMAWWRDARFGLFIHWGLYSIPAGKGGTPEKTSHGEWIRDTAQIPVAEYDKLISQFNPVKFNADSWVSLAQEAGMAYLVVTSKHHDGFCLFDTKQTTFNVMNTPFKRDIMKEIADACRKSQTTRHDAGADYQVPVRFCMYHSIMDWHHPDYLPRRPWEKAQRPETGADFDRYVAYMKNQLREILTQYGPVGLIWFDGQWEGTWNNDRGRDLQAYVRSLQPSIIINSRVGRGGGQYGLDDSHGGAMGDYTTPEQFIPDTAPGVDWETCMTMNQHWGYNAVDKDFKSTTDLIQKLCDIASKGGNFLLNVGPTAEGEIPPESVERLKQIGEWMQINSQAIHGTLGSPLPSKPSWGRVTMKRLPDGNTRLFLHVFDMPASKKIEVAGILNKPIGAGMLRSRSSSVIPQLKVSSNVDVLTVDASSVNAGALVGAGPVVVYTLDVAGEPDAAIPPRIDADADIFVDSIAVAITSPRKNIELHYTIDGTEPVAASPTFREPLQIKTPTTIAARSFRGGTPVSPVVKRTFTQVTPRPALSKIDTAPGLDFECYEGDWDKVPNFRTLTPSKKMVVSDITLKEVTSDDTYAVLFAGYITIPSTGVYTFYLSSDDGSKMMIDNKEIINNDGLHSQTEKSATVALEAGLHRIHVAMFEKSGGAALELQYAGPGIKKQKVPPSAYAR